jgi:hypothetical protein
MEVTWGTPPLLFVYMKAPYIVTLGAVVLPYPTVVELYLPLYWTIQQLVHLSGYPR